MAFFESLAVRKGRAEFLDAHLARLREACRLQQWPLHTLNLDHAGEAIPTLCGPGPVFARLYLTGGDGGPSSPVASPRLYLYAEPRDLAPPKPYRLRVHLQPHLPLFGGQKTANYWANAENYSAALRAGADEALLFNPAGELISACMANAFLKIGEQWITPPIASGARRGVIREWVMQRRNISERVIRTEDLDRANAAFLTSSWHGVIPVAVLNSRPLETSFAEELRIEFNRSRL
jgi:branched-chain amino acid aminotransferase